MAKQKSWWHPEELKKRRNNLESRARILRSLHQFFAEEGFLAVDTPALQTSPGLEPHLQAFRTEWQGPGGEHKTFYLHTSPEFAMKKLLVGGFEKIYQVAKVFRNRESSRTHHPEFAMLEWYRRGSDYRAIMDDCEKLLQACARAIGKNEITWHGMHARLDESWERISIAELFKRDAGIDLAKILEDRDAFAAEARRLGVPIDAEDRWDDIFFRVFFEKIERKLGIGRPTIVYDYPISMAALSRPKESDPRWAERFEVYICGMELANAFSELTDADVQRERFESDMALKQKLYGERYPIDPEFLAALECGLPDCAGIALGVDRLVMLLTGANDISEIVWAPVETT